jgi:hypothetical protein
MSNPQEPEKPTISKSAQQDQKHAYLWNLSISIYEFRTLKKSTLGRS